MSAIRSDDLLYPVQGDMDSDVEESILNNLEKNKKRMVCIYVYPWDGKKEISSYELLRRVVGRYLGREIQNCTVCRKEEHDKPYIEELPEVHFSISHSGGYWACAVCDAEVGLDLQEVRTAREEKVARRFFHPAEIDWLEEHGFDEFSRLWAYKESYVKYTGTGLRDGLDYFSVVDGDLKAYQQEVPFHEGFYMVVTTEKRVTVSLSDNMEKAP
ncbi:MAG: 4'-phosphopantetheinyl transferase superfamily protein [Clostridiales bacterium]|nr:4'-phosphopantetheinyl transferase superfamily protein [Clostridiales bacterium]